MSAITAAVVLAVAAAGTLARPRRRRQEADCRRILRETLAHRPERDLDLDLDAGCNRLRTALRDHTEQGDQQ